MASVNNLPPPPTGKRAFFESAEAKEARELEGSIQNWICLQFDLMIDRGHVFAYAGDMNAAKRSHYEAMWAKATGLKAGEPDMRIYLPGGRMILVELKQNASVSKAQKERHALLQGLGHDVRVVRLKTREEARVWAERFILEVAPL